MNILGELSSTYDRNKARISRIKEILNTSPADEEELKEQQSSLEKEDARFIQLHLEHSGSKYHMYFGEYNTDMFLKLCPYMRYQEYSPGEKVFSKEDSGKWFYFIIDGTVHVLETSSTGEEKISSIHNSNEVFGLKKKSEEGELFLRNRDAVAQCNTIIIQIDMNEYELIRSQRILSTAEEKVEFLGLNIPGLRKVDRAIVHEVETLFQKEKGTKGYRIIQQDKPNDFLYFGYSGELRIYISLPSPNINNHVGVGKVQKGDCIGIVSATKTQNSKYSVQVSTDDAVLYRIMWSTFYENFGKDAGAPVRNIRAKAIMEGNWIGTVAKQINSKPIDVIMNRGEVVDRTHDPNSTRTIINDGYLTVM